VGEARALKVRYTLPALADLEAIMDYLASQSPQGATRIKARLKSLVELLPAHPRLGTRTDDAAIRRLVVTPYPYLIFYEVAEDEITIHAVRRAGRNPATMPGSREG
jgi:toxin ParE1/3/4